MALVNIEISDRVALITLSDPDRRNALSLAMADELSDAIESLEARDVGAMVITGAGPAFCAGADLGVLARAEGTELVRVYRSFGRVFQSTIPSVAAVNGPAVGAGFNLAMVCDLRLAGESARFDTAFLRLAVHPGGGATWLLQRQLGLQGAMALTSFQETLNGRDAERLGLAWRCLPDADLLPVAVDMARRAAAHPPALAHKLRNTLSRTAHMEDYGPAVQIEMDEQLWSLRQPEAVALLNARMQEIGYEPTAAAPPPVPDARPPAEPAPAAFGERPRPPRAEPPPPSAPPQPGDPGFKLFKDD
jgi:enoyl-CoA hydratase